MVFNATFNNISVISSVLLVEETRVPGENYRPAYLAMSRIRTHNISGDRH
jgi:hypothetical protein